MKLTASRIAEITSGTLHGPDVTVDGAAIDSRRLQPGALFVPIVAERDGHQFVDAALAAGAAAYLTAREPGEGTAIGVSDTAGALAALGAWARSQLAGPVIAITGSAGKTSTKDMVGAILRPELPTAEAGRHAARPAPLSARRAVSVDFGFAPGAAFGDFGSRSGIAFGLLRSRSGVAFPLFRSRFASF